MNKSAYLRLQERSRGMILVIVLWAVSIMTVMIAALSVNVQRSLILSGTETKRMKSEALVEGGIDIAAAAIVGSGDKTRTLADGHPFRVDVGGGSIVEIKIRGASGFVDVNRANQQLLASVIGQATGSVETGQAIAKEIAELRDKLSAEPVGEGGNEEQQANDEKQQGQPAPAFMSVFQLYGLNSADPASVAKFLPYVGLYSAEGHVNPAYAPEAVLAMVPGITPEEVKTLVDARRRDDWKDTKAEEVLNRLEEFLSLDESDVFIVDVRLIGGAGLIPDTQLEATLLIDRNLDLPYHVLAWSW